jgi:diacylglycerol kinase (ATP)
MKKRICFIINPISGVSKKNNLPEIVLSNLDKTLFEPEFVYTNSKGHAIELTKQAVDNECEIICAVGGDGSVHEVSKSLIHTSSLLAIIPCGSGNGFARHLGLPLNIKKAIQRINTGREIIVDTGLLNGNHFINVCGFGFDAHIAHKFDNYHKRGFSAYMNLILKEFKKYKTQNVIVKRENEFYEKNILLTTIANASQFGNGFKISPSSQIDDGKFELMLYQKATLGKMLPDLMRFFNGSIVNSSNVKIDSFKEIELLLENNIAHADGEPLLLENNIAKVKVLPKSLKILI